MAFPFLRCTRYPYTRLHRVPVHVHPAYPIQDHVHGFCSSAISPWGKAAAMKILPCAFRAVTNPTTLRGALSFRVILGFDLEASIMTRRLLHHGLSAPLYFHPEE